MEWNLKNNRNNTLIQNQQPKNDNVNTDNNHRKFLVGPSFSGKTYLMLKNPPRIPNRDLYIITKSPPEQYSTSQIKTKEIREGIKHQNEHENTIIFFDDILGSSNSKYIDLISIRRRHNNLDNCFLSQLYFDLPKRSIRNTSQKTFLFDRTLRDIENIYRDVCRYIWFMMNPKIYVENHGRMNMFIFVLIHSKKEIKEDIVFVIRAKTQTQKALLKRNLFD